MDELTVVDGGTKDNQVQETIATPEVKADGVQQDVKPPEQVNSDWMKDTRYERMWKKDPNGLYKSYSELEKVYNPLKEKYSGLEKQVNDLTSVFKEFGVEPTQEQIKSAMRELKGLKDPNSLPNKRSAFLGKWLDDDANLTRYGQKVNDFFEQLETQKLLDDHPGLTREQAMKQAALERKVQELEQIEKSRVDKENESTATKRMNDGLNEAKALSERVGLAWSKDISDKVVKSCLDKNVSTDLVFHEFMRLYAKEIETKLIEKTRQDQLKELNKQKDAVIPAGGSSGSKGVSKNVSFKDSALAALGVNKT